MLNQKNEVKFVAGLTTETIRNCEAGGGHEEVDGKGEQWLR